MDTSFSSMEMETPPPLCSGARLPLSIMARIAPIAVIWRTAVNQAASSISRGMLRTNPQNINTASPAPNPKYTNIIPIGLDKCNIFANFDNVNITIWKGTIILSVGMAKGFRLIYAFFSVLAAFYVSGGRSAGSWMWKCVSGAGGFFVSRGCSAGSWVWKHPWGIPAISALLAGWRI